MSGQNWQNYERITTGETVKFLRTSPGKYEREDGVEFNTVQLNRYYTWIGRSAEAKAKLKQTWERNPVTGFMVRQNLAKNERSAQ